MSYSAPSCYHSGSEEARSRIRSRVHCEASLSRSEADMTSRQRCSDSRRGFSVALGAYRNVERWQAPRKTSHCPATHRVPAESLSCGSDVHQVARASKAANSEAGSQRGPHDLCIRVSILIRHASGCTTRAIG